VAKAVTDIDDATETSRGRYERRRVSIWAITAEERSRLFGDDYKGLRYIIRVERWRGLGAMQDFTTHYYLSSYEGTSARRFGEIVRLHWHIENRLHHPRDVAMHEDGCGLRGFDIATSFSTLRTIAMNLFREAGYSSIKYAIIAFANRIDPLAEMFTRT
jgi:predicted transposase YbfD/YdcC